MPTKLPYGVSTFRQVIRDQQTYVDKTDLVYALAQGAPCTFLSRPRRFGKSMLVDTLDAYWQGERELFRGLKIEALESEWRPHPVLRFDFSNAGEGIASFRKYLNSALQPLEECYGLAPCDTLDDLAVRFRQVVLAAHHAKGTPVVILIDEYDFPLQHAWGSSEYQPIAALCREFFAIVKSEAAHIRSAFITGIARFAGVALFSQLNNMANVSFDPRFAALCGITHEELLRYFGQELRERAAYDKLDFEGELERFRRHYDGYHFSSDNPEAVYNPFCVLGDLLHKEIRNPLGASGFSTLIGKFFDTPDVRTFEYDHCRVPRLYLEDNDIHFGDTQLFLYLTGFLTLEARDERDYTLAFPNEMVRETFFGDIIPALLYSAQIETATKQQNLRHALDQGNVNKAMTHLQALMANVPSNNIDRNAFKYEQRYQIIIANILGAIGYRVRTEYDCAQGVIDIVCWTPLYNYLFELKLRRRGGLREAERQIREAGYANPFSDQPQPVIAIALELDNRGGGITLYKQLKDLPCPPSCPTE